MKKIGFIGLGKMGSGMAKSLIRAGYPLVVYNRTLKKAEPFKELGAEISKTPKELGSIVDVVITMVSDVPALIEVLLGEDGAAQSAKRGTIFIDSSTIYAAASKSIAKELNRRGLEMLDAPVLGGPADAEKGQLTFFVGGKKEIFDEVKDLFDAMGRKTYYLGPNGSGCYMKIVVNMLRAVFLANFSELIMIPLKAGINFNTILEILEEDSWGPLIKKYKGRMFDPNAKVKFPISLMTKDIEYALRTGFDLKIPLFTVSAAKGLFEIARSMGLEERDYTHVYYVLRKLAGLG